MTTVQEARQQLEQQRGEVAQKKTEAEDVKQKLREQLTKLPKATQLRLRQQLYAGLEGRKRLQLVRGVEEKIKKGIGQVEDYTGELSTYETQTLQPYEQEIQTIEIQQGAYNVLNREIKETLQEYEGQFTSARSITKVREAFSSAGLDPNLGQQLYEQGATTAGGRQSLWSNGKFLGTYDFSSGDVTPSKEYTYSGLQNRQFTFQRKDALMSIPTIPPPRDLPRDVIIKDITPMQSLPTGFGILSAQTFTPTQDLPMSYAQPQDLILTTGSPIQYQPISTIEAVKYDPLSDIKRIGQLAKEVGYFKAIPSYVGEKLKEGVTKAQVMLGKPFGEPEPLTLPSGTKLTTPAKRISQIGGTVGQVGTYFTSAGIPLLVGGGVEEYATPVGRERMKLTGQAIEQKYGVPKESAYLIPAAEIGLGLWGLKGTKFDVKRPIVREQPLVVDVKFAKGYGRTEGATERVVTTDSLGRQVVIEKGILSAYVKDIGITGYKRVVTTPLREFFGMKPIYSGTIAEQRATGGFFSKALELPTNYQKAYNLLRQRGYTDYGARQALRQVRPQYQRTIGTGEMTIVSRGGEQTTRLFTGTQKTTYLQGEKGGVKFLQKQPKKVIVDETAKSIGEGKYKTIDEITGVTKGGKIKGKVEEGTFGIVGFERLETKPLQAGESLLPETLVKGAGKRTERFKGVVGAEYVKEVKPFALDIGKTFRVTPETTYARYRTADISKKIIPSERRLLSGEGMADISRAEPKFTIYDESVIPARGFMGKGAKSSPQYLEQLYKIEQAKAETTLSLLKTKPVKTISPIKAKPVSYPKMVGGEGIQVSDYSGVIGTTTLKGFEESIEYGKSGMVSRNIGGISDSKLLGNFRGDFSGRVSEIMGQDTSQVGATTLDLSTATTTKQDTKLRTIQGEVSRVKFLEGQPLRIEQQPRVSLRELTKLREETRLKEALKVDQALKQETKLGQRTTTTTTTKTPQKTPTPKIPFRFILRTEPSAKEKERKLMEEAFEVFGRRYGKDILLKKVRTKEEAKKVLRGFLTGTLGAGGFVESGGKKVQIDLGIGFAPSKREAERVIQKREQRLKGFQERKEIKQTRRKAKRIKWF